MTNNDFSARQQKAIEEMKKMNQKSQNPKPQPQPEKPPQKPTPQPDFLSSLNIPFLNDLKTDGDLTLILGLLLLLLNEKADKRLLFALLYILL